MLACPGRCASTLVPLAGVALTLTLMLGPLPLPGPQLAAADAPTPGAGPAPAPAAPADPTDAVVAQGAQTYHQRDVDALALVADRYINYRLTPVEEDQLHKALARLLVAREPLVQAMQAIPASLVGGKAGDAFLLDVLDYRPEPDLRASAVAAPPAQPAPLPPASAPSPARAEAPPAAGAETGAGAAPSPAAPVIIALPPLTLSRSIQGEKRQVVMGIALCFADEATSQHFQERAPIIRDTILGALDGLSDADFCEPKQTALKHLVQDALNLRLADFPKDGVLIPQLDAGLAGAGGSSGSTAGSSGSTAGSSGAGAPAQPAAAAPATPR